MFTALPKASDLVEKAQRLGLPLSQVWLVACLVTVIWYRPDLIIQYRRLCLIIIIAYELLVLILIPLAWMSRFAGRVWTEEFEGPAVKNVATQIRRMLSRHIPRNSYHYSRLVTLEQEVYNTRGLGFFDRYTLKLDQVFVELRISDLENTIDLPLDPLARRDFSGAKTIWDFIRVLESNLKREKRIFRRVVDAVFPQRRIASKRRNLSTLALAVVGPPGCGKSTLLQHVSFALATEQHRKYGIPGYIPVLLFLREHVEEICSNENVSISNLTHNHYVKKYGEMDDAKRLIPSAAWLSNRLMKGRCLILLDGLDEVADDGDRRRISAWVERQMIVYPDCLFVVTSRPRGYVSAPLKAAQVVEVQPFTDDQVTQFVRSWYLANETVRSGGVFDEGVRYRARRDSQDLLARMSKKKALKDLSVNPLLLNMITMVHKYRGALPGTRVELYREICEVLLGRWVLAKKTDVASVAPPNELSASQKLAILMPLAARMMELQRLTIPLPDVRDVIEPVLRRVVGTKLDFADALKELHIGTALLQEREQGYWGFCHLTFQEYLTASHWRSGGDNPYDWNPLVAQSWWHETLRLYSAQSDATSILIACLEVGTLPALTLAADIMDEGPHEIREDVRNAVVQRIQESLEAEDLAERRFAAEVRLSQRLNSLCSINDETLIDLGYISCAEYQLFLDEKLSQDRFVAPEHWGSLSFPRGLAREPITGVKSSDAAEFCEWLGSKYGKAAQYRLPTPHENSKYSTGVDSLGTWCRDDEDYKMILSSDSLNLEIQAWFEQLESPGMPRPISVRYDSDLTQAVVYAAALICDLRTIVSDALEEADHDVMVKQTKGDFDTAWSRSRVATIGRDSRLLTSYQELFEILPPYVDFLLQRLPDGPLDPTEALFGFTCVLASRMPTFVSSERTEVQVKVQRLAQTVESFKRVVTSRKDQAEQQRATFAAGIEPILKGIVSVLRSHSVGAALDYAILLQRLLDVVLANKKRRPLRVLMLHVVEYSYKQHELMSEKRDDRWEVSLRARRELAGRKREREYILDTYWWQIIIHNREGGQLGSWEAIRIVKEMVTPEEGIDLNGADIKSNEQTSSA